MRTRLVLLALVLVPGVVALTGMYGGSALAAFLEQNGQVVIEAENHDGKIDRGGKSWLLQTSPTGHVGSGHMFSQPNSGTTIDTGYTTTSPELSYQVKFASTGTYHVWLRGYAASTADNSLHVGLDGQAPTSADRLSLSTLNAWTWFKSTSDGPVATLEVTSTGLHTVNVWMREDGFRLDRLLLTKDSAYVPSGNGPAESPRG